MLIWGQAEEVAQRGICKADEFSQFCRLLNRVSVRDDSRMPCALGGFCLAVLTFRGACELH